MCDNIYMNFYVFIDEELRKLVIKGLISDDIHLKIEEDLHLIMHCDNILNSSLSELPFDIDEAIRIFMMRYQVDIDEIHNEINYSKLVRFIELFRKLLIKK